MTYGNPCALFYTIISPYFELAELEFNDYKLVEFEGRQFYAMKGADVFLAKIYGDYMKLPPVDKRKPKQGWITFLKRADDV
ncbi:MAG: hypothetical protein IJ604_11870 [Prevotella sp.]|nr:hypothetical protein [Prevotella sp.]